MWGTRKYEQSVNGRLSKNNSVNVSLMQMAVITYNTSAVLFCLIQWVLEIALVVINFHSKKHINSVGFLESLKDVSM